jgi:Leucine-rich repeat (LRR) protein
LELSEYSLKKLDLSGCGLTKLPGSLELYRKLEELNLSNNPRIHSDRSFLKIPKCRLKKLDLSGCGLTELPNDLEECGNLQEFNFSNNFFDHQDLLEKLNSGKVFSLGFHQSGKELLKFTASRLVLFKPTCRIIFEDAVYTQSGGGKTSIV